MTESSDEPKRKARSGTGVVRRGRSLARRQAVLTAGSTFIAAIAIAATAVWFTSANVREQVRDRFRALANERQRQMQMVVSDQYEMIGQIISRRRLGTLVAEALTSEPDADRVREMNAILVDAVNASDRYLSVSIVSNGRVLASSNANRVDTEVTDESVGGPVRNGPMMTAPYWSGGAVLATVKATIDTAGGPATAVAEVDATNMMVILGDTEPLGPGGTLRVISAAASQFAESVGADATESLPESDFRQADLAGEPHLIYWQPVVFNPGIEEDWRLVAALPQASAAAPVRHLQMWLLPAIGLLTLAVTGLSYAVARRLGRRLERLTRIALRSAESGRPEEADIPGDDEIAKLAAAFNSMGDRVKEDLSGLRREADRHRGEKDRLSEELTVASEVQKCLYPLGPLHVAGLEVTGDALPAEQLCGDYFDYFEVDGAVYFALGDVSGHGVGPALLMVEVRSVLRSLRWERLGLVSMMTRLNERLFRESPRGRFVTLLLGRLDLETGKLQYVGAGHRGLIVRKGGDCCELPSTGTVVGLMDGIHWVEQEEELADGDLLCVASDGIEEMQNADGDQFGWGAVCETVCGARSRPLAEIVSTLLDKAVAHAGGRPPRDDRTVLLMRRAVA